MREIKKKQQAANEPKGPPGVPTFQEMSEQMRQNYGKETILSISKIASLS